MTSITSVATPARGWQGRVMLAMLAGMALAGVATGPAAAKNRHHVDFKTLAAIRDHDGHRHRHDPKHGSKSKAAAKPAVSPRSADDAKLDDGELMPSCKFPRALCGFVNGQGKIAIQPAYDWVEDFGGNFARVKTAGKYGLLSRAGKEVVAQEWDYLSRPQDDQLVGLKDGKFGVIDALTGKVMLEPKYVDVVPMQRNVFLVNVTTVPAPKPVVTDLERRENNSQQVSFNAGRWGIIYAAGQWAVRPKFSEVRSFGSGIGQVIWGKPSHKWQLASFTGELLTGAVFDNVEPATDGVAIVRTGNQSNAVDARGKFLLPPDAEAVRRRPDGMVAFQNGEKVGVVGRGGQIHVDAKYDSIDAFVNGYASVVEGSNRYWIDGSGKTVPSDQAALSAKPEQAAATSIKKSPMPKFQSPRHVRFLTCGDGVTVVARGERWGYLDPRNLIFIPAEFKAAGCFDRGVAWALLPDKDAWCQIDKRGVQVASVECACKPPVSGAGLAKIVNNQSVCRPLNQSAKGSD